jgi:hypothetical protein
MTIEDDDPRPWTDALPRARAGESCCTCGARVPKDIKDGDYHSVRFVPLRDSKGFAMCSLCAMALAALLDEFRHAADRMATIDDTAFDGNGFAVSRVGLVTVLVFKDAALRKRIGELLAGAPDYCSRIAIAPDEMTEEKVREALDKVRTVFPMPGKVITE